MSGPKISLYQVAPELRQNILDQFACMRRCNQLEAEIIQLMEALSVCQAQCEVQIERAEALLGSKAAAQVETLQAASAAINQAKKSVMEDDHKRKKVPVKAFVPASKADTQALDNVKAIELALKAIAEPLREAVKGPAAEVKEIRRKLDLEVANREGEIRQKLSQAASFFLQDYEPEPEAPKCQAEIDKLTAYAADLLITAELRTRAKQAADKLRKGGQAEMLRTYLTVTVRPLLKQLEDAAEQYAAAEAARKAKYRQYAALCEELGQQPDLPDNSAAAKLDEAIEQLECVLMDREERAYIAKAMNQVMAEMGYDVIGDRHVVKRSGRSFHNTLFKYDNGKAVSVTQAANGQITMELGGLDHGDRLPNEQEAENLRDSMQMFCQDFKTIERRLREKGVLVGQRVELLPPDTAYATMINLDEYNMLTDNQVEVLDVSGTSGSRAVQRTMGVDD